MKVDIHPKYFDAVEIRCSCGNVVIAGSTREKLKTELCSKCHPFYTGQQKLVDTAGRVDKFEAKRKRAVSLKEESKRRAEEKKKKPEVYKEKEIPVEVIERATKWGKPLGKTLSEEVVKKAKVAKKKAVKKKVVKKKVAKKK